MNIYEKLQTCRCELQKKSLKKSGKNEFAKFNYYELADFLPAVNEMFLEHKLFANFSITEEDGATLKITDIEKPEDIIWFSSPVAELELKGCNSIQALGGTHTYLKRYLYINALEIVEADLFDKTSGQPTKSVATKTTAEDIKEVMQGKEVKELKCSKCGKVITEGANKNFNGMCSACYVKAKKEAK